MRPPAENSNDVRKDAGAELPSSTHSNVTAKESRMPSVSSNDNSPDLPAAGQSLAASVRPGSKIDDLN